MGTPLLTLDHVSVGYERRVVLRDLVLKLGRGSFTGLLGANGSGKSTLIKTVIGVIPPLAGELRFHAHEGRAPTLGYVPQREALDSNFLLSGIEVVLMGACGRVRPGRFFGRVEHDLALECLRRTGAVDLARRLFSELSGGQKQRVLIARALAARPDLLLLDEPTAGIDAAAAQAIMDLLQSLNSKDGMTILMVNHDLRAVRKCARDVVWINEGKLICGTAAELLAPGRIEELLSLQLV
jgi:manganese/zinc/iron transport system ATP- binding protein